ncbi:MAG: ATP-dependent DNA helicase RecG [bacterium]|nr:ATP-dependent DNA helicase RecG [bacterium]
MVGWNDPVSFIHGLTPHERRVISKLGMETVGNLLTIFPRRYDDFSKLAPIAELVVQEPVTIRVSVDDIRRVPIRRLGFVMIQARVSDESGSLRITWFNQPWLLKTLKPGDEIYLSGTLEERPRFGRGMMNPLWEPIVEDGDDEDETVTAGTISPVYPLTTGVTQKTLRKIMKATVDDLDVVPDPIPETIRTQASLTSLSDAIHFLHRPESEQQAEKGRRRFAFGELLLYQLALHSARTEADIAGAPVVAFDEHFAKRFAMSLPFQMTDDQKKAVWASVQDIAKNRPMRRLLQGDVGAGKTAVGMMLSALVFRSGASSAFMAPTDLLAKQHAATFERFFSAHGIPVLLMTSKMRWITEGKKTQELSVSEAKERIRAGRVVLVGTHALIQRGQSPPDLALAIVDEQHRFGVAQREALLVSSREDGLVPHLLSMTATPIPRSLALTLLGDLDISVLRQKPKGRQPVATIIVHDEKGRDQAYAKIRSEIEAGHRAFIVCPLIDPSDTLGARSVQTEMKQLSEGPLKGMTIASVHGKMSPDERDDVMRDFSAGRVSVLVATTVVEVGVDIPRATVMLVEGAERFGLAQLHQLRGRVGRARYPSVCFLAMSQGVSNVSRLQILAETNDGFLIAEEDLKHRGSGNLLGTEQSGQVVFQAARPDDIGIMTSARDASTEMILNDPSLTKYPELKAEVERIRKSAHRE